VRKRGAGFVFFRVFDNLPSGKNSSDANRSPWSEKMTSGALSQVTAKTAAEICRRFTLDEGAKGLLDDRLPPKQFLDLVIEKGHLHDAVKVLAYGLPKREAVWWAIQCVRAVAGASPPPKVAAALQAAEKWVTNPTDDSRKACLPAAEAAEYATPAGCTALAAYWSGGSYGPPDAKLTPPAEDWTHHVVSGAVLIAAVLPEPEKGPDKLKKFLDLGMQVGSGANRWKS
jgi:hypothetical protein